MTSKREPLRSKRREFRRDHDGGDVSRPRLVLRSANVDAHAIQHGLNRLLRERRISQGVARSVQADDKAVADDLIDPDAFEVGYVLDARAGFGSVRQAEKKKNSAAANLIDRPPRVSDRT